MRRLTAALTIAALSTSLGLANAEIARAERPVDFVDERTVDDVDPCTGEDITVQLRFEVTQRQLTNGHVIYQTSNTALASNGASGTASEIVVINGRWLIDVYTYVTTNDRTGDRYLVKARVRVDLETGDVVRMDRDAVCLGDRT